MPAFAGACNALARQLPLDLAVAATAQLAVLGLHQVRLVGAVRGVARAALTRAERRVLLLVLHAPHGVAVAGRAELALFGLEQRAMIARMRVVAAEAVLLHGRRMSAPRHGALGDDVLVALEAHRAVRGARESRMLGTVGVVTVGALALEERLVHDGLLQLGGQVLADSGRRVRWASP